ncbi:MAG: hypothetical protein PWP45_413 [Tepidanaerobacteraceae bacterium]|nr:hypothetical protein [Tepidanaerobacteraceae bacterium]
MWFSNEMLEFSKELTSRVKELDFDNLKEIIGRLAQEYIGRVRNLLEQTGQETNEAELREAGNDLLALFAGKNNMEVFKHRIKFGAKLGTTEIPLEQLIKVYDSLFGRCCDEIAKVYQISEKEVQT